MSRLRQQLFQGVGQGAAAQPDDQHVVRVGLQEQRTQHHAGIFEYQLIGSVAIDTRLPTDRAHACKAQATQVRALVDQDLSVLRALGMDQSQVLLRTDERRPEHRRQHP